MKLDKIYEILDSIAPFSTQEDWDNSGWQLKLDDKEVKKILVTLDLDRDSLNQAIEKDIDLIVTHHPLLFESVKSIDSNSFLYELIKNDISLISLHTNFDKVFSGNNDYYGGLLGLEGLKGEGFIRFSKLREEVSLKDLLYRVKAINGEEPVFYTGNLDSKIKKIGFCVGSGSDFIQEAYEEGCDCFITGDIKYHTWQYANSLGIALIDGTHFHSEKNFSDNMYEMLAKKIGDSVSLEKPVNLKPPYQFI